MRPALGFENWTPDTDDITALKQAEQNFLDGEVEEDHSDPPPLDEPIVPQVMDYGTYGAEGSDILRLPEAVGAYQRSEGIQSEPYGPSRRTSKISSIGAPTPYSKPDAANKPLPELAPRPSQSESSQGIKRAVEQELPDSDSQETKRIAVEDVEGEPTPAGDPTQAPAATTTLPPVPEERVGASEALLGLVETNPGQFELDEPGDDGSPPLAARSERMINLPEVFKSEYDGPTLDADDMDQVEDCHPDWEICYAGDQTQLVNPTTLTRKEQKALDREIPWREIVSRGGDYLKQFVSAAQKECTSWKQWGPVEPMTSKEAQKVLGDPVLRKRVLKARTCYRDKNIGRSPLKPKARVVVLGHRDPDLSCINRDAPTPSRTSEMVLLTVFICGVNGGYGVSSEWQLYAADASTAFPQGQQPTDERPGELYMMPPEDPIMGQVEDGWNHPMYRNVGNIYGLANAPRLWAQEVISKLTAANFKAHTLDHMLFLHRDEKQQVNCAIIVYVDDFLIVRHESFPLEILTNMFKWGDWTEVRQGIRFKGKNIRMTKDQETKEWILTIDQEDFIKGMTIGQVPRSRSQSDPTLTAEELTEFRSCCGSLQWLAGQTRPDIASAVSLSSKGLETKIDDLKRLYRLMSYVKATSDVGITLKPIKLCSETIVVSYGDCSWANAEGMKSQEGIIVVLSSSDCLEGQSRCIPMDWKTCRTPRVVRSTLAGEAYAADDAIDRAHHVNATLTEILTGDSILNTGPILKHAHATDCRSLFDSVISSNPNTEEKRVLLTIRAIQEALDSKMMRWVPTDKMIADILTKDSDNLRWSFLPWMKDPTCQLKRIAE